MEERNQQKLSNPSRHLSDSDTSDDEPINLIVKTSNEERHYDTIHSLAIATHVALSYSTAQANGMVAWGPTRKVTIKKPTKEKAENKESKLSKLDW